MLDQSYYRKADEIIEHYGRKASSLIPIMQDIQGEYRYLPGELLTYVAGEIGIKEAKAFSVATFYENFSFEAKGKYIIKVCDGTACHVKKSAPILEALHKTLGLSKKKHTTDDMMFTVETVSCLGAFGEQAIVTCTSQDNPEVSATCTVDYRERVSSAELVIRANNKDYTINETPAIPLADSATASMNVVKTVGTIESEFETTVSVSFTDEYVELLESTYGDSWGTGFSGKYTLSMGAQSLSGLFEDLIVPDIPGAYFDSGYAMMLYAEIIDWTNSQSVAVLSFTITVKNTSTSETSTYVYDCPLADIVVPVGDVTLNEDGIIF